MTTAPYQLALDEIYATFMRVKHLNKGRFDRDARQPQRLLALARDRGILPPPERTIKVSGSKGKGTTARIAARILQNEFPHAKIGLFVSPEEDDHNDRMRINGVAMTVEQFVQHYTQLKPQLVKAQAELVGSDYLSPLGIFLLIALNWFQAEGVDYFVLETGRGVTFDEVGQIRSKVSILTSIMLEHADKLGPTLADIATDKLSICQTSARVFAPIPVLEIARNLLQLSIQNLTSVATSAPVSSKTSHTDIPEWVHINAALAQAGVAHLCNQKAITSVSPDLWGLSASFGLHQVGGHTYLFEGLIHTDSLDRDLLDSWQRGGLPLNVIASFPDDKDREQLLAAFKARGWPVSEVVLTGTRGYLDYARTTADPASSVATFAFDNDAGFAAWLATRPAAGKPGRTYLVGTQTYIRLVRKALALIPKSGDHNAKS